MWAENKNKLEQEFIFADFSSAITFINRIAEIADKMDHHPEICNTYNKVKLRLCTHSAGNTITEKDRELAKMIDKIYPGPGQ